MTAVPGRRGRLVARCALGLLVVYGAIRVIDTQARWASGRVPGDSVEHALVVYALLTCGLAAFPRLSPLVAAGGMLALGLGVELVQSIPGVPGGWQLRDLAADLVGVLLAILPMLVVRRAAVEGAYGRRRHDV